MTDPSVTVRFPLAEGPLEGADLLVWTTTPWTLVSNTAVAVHPDVTYVVAARSGEPGRVIVAEPLFARVLGEGWHIVSRHAGSELAGTHYRRPFDLVEIPDAHRVLTADFVTTEDGTGLVHLAPAFGADDFAATRAAGMPVVNPIKPDGRFDLPVPLVGGVFFRDANARLIEDLKERDLLFRGEAYEHSYPHCWRCHTPLLYYALPAWYIKTTAIKDRLLEENDRTNWFPETIKEGRYGEWLRNNVDWSLSRSRYWGTPLPVWLCADDHATCVGSLKELGELAGHDLSALDPHRPFVDDVTFACPECGGEARRVPDVIDAWYDSGSMPFAQWGAPHRQNATFADCLPRAVHLRGDRPDPRLVLLAHGRRHARLRPLLVRERALPRAAPRRGRPQDEQAPRQRPGADPAHGQARRRRAALVHGGGRPAVGGPARRRRGARGDRPQGPADVLEHRVVLRPVRERVGLDARHARPGGRGATGGRPVGARRAAPDRTARWTRRWSGSTRPRRGGGWPSSSTTCPTGTSAGPGAGSGRARSRRAGPGRNAAAFATLYECLETLTRLMAPIAPFLTDYVWDVLRTADAPDSVHLAAWPEVDQALLDPELSAQMALVRRLVELGRAARASSGVRTRQPLGRALVGAAGWRALPDELRDQIADELNVQGFDTLASIGGDLVEYVVKPNFRELGKRFGKQTPKVAQAITSADAAELAHALRDSGTTAVEAAEVGKVELTPADVIITERPRSGWAVESAAGETVGLDLTVTPELRRAGLVREVIRLVQDARKNAGLQITDRIELWWRTTDTDLDEALREHGAEVASEVLANAWHDDEPDEDLPAVRDEDLRLTFWLRRSS